MINSTTRCHHCGKAMPRRRFDDEGPGIIGPVIFMAILIGLLWVML